MAQQHGYPRRRFIQLGVSILTVGASAPALAGSGDLAVIVHANNHASLLPSEIEAIFRATKRHWANGDPIVPFNLVPQTAERTLFDQTVLGLSPAAVARYWIDRKIRGGAPPPRAVPNAGIALRVVASLATSIAYVPPDLLTSDVRAVALIRNGALASARARSAPWEDV